MRYLLIVLNGQSPYCCHSFRNIMLPMRNNIKPNIFLTLISTLFTTASRTNPLISCPASIKINVLAIPNDGIDFEDRYIINAPKIPPISQIGFTDITLG